MKNEGNLKIGPLTMRQFKKRYFGTYSDAEIWLSNTTEVTDNVIRKENDQKYYIFVEEHRPFVSGINTMSENAK